MKDKEAGATGSAAVLAAESKSPNDLGNKRMLLNNLPPRISINKGGVAGGSNPQFKLKIRTNSEEPNVVRCQSA